MDMRGGYLRDNRRGDCALFPPPVFVVEVGVAPGCHTTGEPPCCGGKPDKKPKCGCEDHGKKPAPGSSPCAACTGNCPLSRSDHHEN